MFKSLLAKLAAMSLLSKTIAVAAAAVIVVGAVAVGLTTQNPSVDPQGPQDDQQQIVDVEDKNEDHHDKEDVDGSAGTGDASAPSKTEKDDKDKTKLEEIIEEIFVQRYTVKFVTNGGSELKNARVVSGTAISSFETPYKAEHIFLGWYYDEELTQAVESDDKVTENVTLYASYLEQLPLETLETVNFASAEDVDGKNFSIYVVSGDEEMTAADVLAAIDVDDLSDPDATDLITVGAVAGAENTFKVSGKGGFNEGGSYRITLNNENLTFKDQPETAREFNFTVHRDEVMNLTMQSDIQYIPMGELGIITQNGATVSSLDISFYESNGATVSPAELTTGSFTYSGNLAVGETICVYEGAHPTLRDKDTPKDQLGDMAYLEITGKADNTYTYESAEAEDVLFMPDVLPMPADADTDTDAATITVENKYLDYSADLYSYMNLDSQTTVDVGDFFAFYTGDLTVATTSENAAELTGYGKVTAVAANGDSTTTITYIAVTWEEVESCMDVYTDDTLSGAELLEGVDTSQMEAEIEQQAYDSGFAEEAAMYLTSLALATENFTALSDNVNLEDYKVTLTDGTPVSPETLQLMAGSGVSVEIEKIAVKPSVSTKPTHLGNINGTNADEKGLSISLDVMVVFNVGADDADGYLEITVTGSFIEEIGVDMGANAEAIWDWAVIIPYISDIKASAHVDTMNYTAVSFNATMITKEKDDSGNGLTDALDMANELKNLLSKMPSNEDEAKSTQEKMVQRYAQIIREDSDWIKVVEYNIVEVRKSFPFGIPLININFSVDFVVEMDAAISVGFDFEYIEGKRHVFTVELKDQNVYSDTIDLKEKSYQFCFYAMGRIGVRAGITMEFSISAISAKLASVGIEAEAGAYLNLRGYFFYELRYTASQGKMQQYNGAMVMDTGIYVKAGLNASALGGNYSANVKFLNKKWPLYSAGSYKNVLDFSTKQEDMPSISLKQHVRQVVIPSSVFLMRELNLENGVVRDAYYSDMTDGIYPASKIDGYDFVITMTNKKFTYNPWTNAITVNPDEDDVKLTGEMVITYKQNGVAFSSKPIQRTISLYWDNLRDGYMIVPESNGGSYIPMIIGAYESKVKAPANPDRLGYLFDGWYSDDGPYTFPQTMPATDTNIYAKWAPRTDIPYTVEHYLEDLYSETYQLVETESFVGTTDSTVTPATKTYTGYVSPAQASIKVEADGSATLSYYYRLETHNVTYNPGEVGGDSVSFTLKYGAEIPVPQMAAKGYRFVGWTVDGTTVVMPAAKVEQADLTYTAKWEKKPDTAYRVEYYVQQSDGRFTLQHMYEGETFTGTTFAVNELRTKLVDGSATADQKYIDAGVISFRDVTVKGIPCDNAMVDGSGKTVIKVNYARAEYTLTFDLGNGDEEIEIKDFVGAEVILPESPTRTGYTFLGWTVDGTTIVTPSAIIGEENVTYTALWKANEYTVKFDANSGTGTMADMAFTYDVAQNLTANAFTRTHYDFAGWGSGVLSYADGENVTNLAAEDGAEVTLTAKWTPKTYTVTYHNVEAGEHTNRTTFTVESDDITLSDPAARVGYTFGGWYSNEGCTGNAVTKIVAANGNSRTLYAKWVPNSNTAYTVEHYLQQLDGTYTKVDTDTLTGTTDSTVTPATKRYTGFKAPAAQTVTIAADGSLLVKYEYTRERYTVSLNANGGAFTDDTTEQTLSFRYGETITIPALKDRDGYAFSGWHYANGAIFNGGTMGAESLTLTAQWEAGKIGYTVYHYQQNVDGSGYTLVNTVNGTADMDSTVTPALESYVGFKAPNSTTTLTITATAADNVVEYKYTRNQYTLTWNLNGGSVSDQTYTSGLVYFDAPITAPVPVKEGYRYRWNTTVATKMPAETVTYTANWTANEYTVKFDANGGNGTMANMNFTYGTAQNLPVGAFTRTGYTFAGWAKSSDGTVAYADKAQVNNLTAEHNGTVTLYAVWTANEYTVKFHANGGTGTMADLSLTYDAAATALTANGFTRTGYTFAGWATAADGAAVYADTAEVGNLTAVDDAVVTLYAKWTLDTYTITYVGAGAHSNPATYTVVSDAITLSAPNARDGYTFGGWYNNEACTGTAVTTIAKGSTGNKTLYAKWEMDTYSILYELNAPEDEVVNDNRTSFTINDNTFTLNAPTRAGYQFLGWFSDEELSVPVDKLVKLEDYRPWTFYAKWNANVYKVVLYKNDGTETASVNTPVTCENGWTATAPDRPGYTFLGWAYSKDGDVVCGNNAKLSDFILSSHEVNDDIELFAQWTLNTCTVTYDLGTGAEANSEANPASFDLHTVTQLNGTVKNATVQLAAPEGIKDGYVFLGWYNGEEKVENIAPTMVATENETLALKAKWGHAGIFSITATEETLNGGPTETAGFNATYTVKRTIPEGAEPIGTHVVSIRTQNGSAIGIMSDFANKEGYDKYHFIHIGATDQNGSVVFGPGSEMKQTITVVEKDLYQADYAPTQFRVGEVKRHYFVQIYKVQSEESGGMTGVIDPDKDMVQRDLPLSPYEITADMFDAEKNTKQAYFENGQTSCNGEIALFSPLKTKVITTADFFGPEVYRYKVDGAYDIQCGLRAKTLDGEVRKLTIKRTGSNKAVVDYNIPSWYQEPLSFEMYDGYEYYGSLTGADISVQLDKWYVRLAGALNYNEAMYVAPLAVTTYQQGEEVMLSMVRNRVYNAYKTVSSSSSDTPVLKITDDNSKLKDYFASAEYVDTGFGSNIIVFKAITKKALTADDVLDINAILLAPDVKTDTYFSKEICGYAGPYTIISG